MNECVDVNGQHSWPRKLETTIQLPKVLRHLFSESRRSCMLMVKRDVWSHQRLHLLQEPRRTWLQSLGLSYLCALWLHVATSLFLEVSFKISRGEVTLFWSLHHHYCGWSIKRCQMRHVAREMLHLFNLWKHQEWEVFDGVENSFSLLTLVIYGQLEHSDADHTALT